MTAFGPALKDWRTRRRMSQLDLALEAEVSSRHISFLETGRARPSREMILRLSDRLEIPREARNAMFTAAGLAPAYVARDRDAKDLAPVHDAVTWMLERHAPYPAFSVDRHWCLVDLNAPAAMLFGAAGLGRGASMIDAVLENAVLRSALVNLDEVLWHGAARLRTESAHFGGDPVLDRAASRFEDAIETKPEHQVYPAIIPSVYRMGDMTLSLFATITQFGTAEDVALSELKIEMMFPADEATRQALEALGKS